MRKILFTVFLLSAKFAFSQNYFEGVITFKTEFTVSDSAEPNLLNKLHYKYGDSLKMYYSKLGDFKRKYINSGDAGNEYQTFLSKKKTLYTKVKNKNYAVPVDVTINSLVILKKVKLPQEDILNISCDCTQYNAKTSDNKDIALVYCYGKQSEMINFAAMEHYSDFFLNDFFITTQRPYLKFSMIAEDYTLTYTALNMESTDLDKIVFKVDEVFKKEPVERSKFF